MIETIRLSKRAKNQLTTLKRRTGIRNWNVLCRWAFCLSLRSEEPPRRIDQTGETAVEMTWKTFGGAHDGIYLALLKQRCLQEGIKLTPKTLQKELHNHIYRGIGYLASNNGLRDTSSFQQLITQASP